jgi:hypothetical protein
MRFLPREQDLHRIRRYRDRHTVLWLTTIVVVVLLVVVVRLLQQG